MGMLQRPWRDRDARFQEQTGSTKRCSIINRRYSRVFTYYELFQRMIISWP